MSLAQISYFPVSVGGYAVAQSGRGAWWFLKRFFGAPITSTGVMILIAGAVLTCFNALYLQDRHYPKRLMAPPVETAPELVIPAPPIRRVSDLPSVSALPEPIEVLPNTPKPVELGNAGPVSGNLDVFNLQMRLAALGLYSGSADGYYGPQTAEAIRAFENAAGLPAVGGLTPEIIQAIAEAASAAPQTTASIAMKNGENNAALNRPAAKIDDPIEAIVEKIAAPVPAKPIGQRMPAGETALVEKIQRGLARLGFLQTRIDGVPGDATAKAIRNFEVFHNYRVTGEISPGLVDLLIAAGGLPVN